MKKKLLLHTCCAICLCYVYELLESTHALVCYFYNPNIEPEPEYHRRLKDVETFCSMKGLELRIGDYDNAKWKKAVRQNRFDGEGSERCSRCFGFRFDAAFKFAKDNNIDTVCTTLSISPHKDAGMINAAGRETAGKYGIEFLGADFKKNGGFKKATALSKEYGFYRQNYCGCIYSKMEREASKRAGAVKA